MSKQRSKKLEVARSATRKKADEVAAELAAAKSQLNKHNEQRNLLDQYQREYCDHLVSSGQSWSSVQLQEYRAFILSITQALSQQEKLMAEEASKIDLLQQRWIKVRQSEKALCKIVEKMESRQVVENGRLQQNISDEFAQRSRYRSK